MRRYIVHIVSHTYSEWSVSPTIEHHRDGSGPSDPAFHPAHHALLDGDEFSYDAPTRTVTLHRSPNRDAILAGVLVLEGHRTYGRTKNGKRLLYRVIPASPRLPHFLVPYDPPAQFFKSAPNKYVLFRFDAWHVRDAGSSMQTRPTGQLHEVLGDVTRLDVFYEYLLYSKNLNHSLKTFTHRVAQDKHALTDVPLDDHVSAGPGIISIDPSGSVDFDDAMSIASDPISGRTTVTVYLANVCQWMERFDWWKSFSARVATIYLPDRRRPMLPTLLSDQLCSLQAGLPRYAMTVAFTYDQDRCVDVAFRATVIRVERNFVYDAPELLTHPTYTALSAWTQQHFHTTFPSSHELVAHWMVEANAACARHLADHQRGLFRQVQSKLPDVAPTALTSEHAIQQWLSCSGQYVPYSDDATPTHVFMPTERYAQVTSPIRRLVDLLNQMMMMQCITGRPLSASGEAFLADWMAKVPYINASMRSIRKIQTDCTLLHRCTSSPHLLEQIHEGIVFDPIRKHSGLYGYMVYLTHLKLLSRLTTSMPLAPNMVYRFKVFVFESECQAKKKIRVEYVPSAR